LWGNWSPRFKVLFNRIGGFSVSQPPPICVYAYFEYVLPSRFLIRNRTLFDPLILGTGFEGGTTRLGQRLPTFLGDGF
jgi:hypothetical protein